METLRARRRGAGRGARRFRRGCRRRQHACHPDREIPALAGRSHRQRPGQNAADGDGVAARLLRRAGHAQAAGRDRHDLPELDPACLDAGLWRDHRVARRAADLVRHRSRRGRGGPEQDAADRRRTFAPRRDLSPDSGVHRLGPPAELLPARRPGRARRADRQSPVRAGQCRSYQPVAARRRC